MLHEIIKSKKKEVEKAKKEFPLNSFKDKLEKSKRDFRKALSKGKMNIIAEIKRKSPSKSINKDSIDIKNTVSIYNRHADAISVLTDKKYFGGTLEDLKEVNEITHLPVLRKDFIIDKYQVYESRFYGADAILLIVSTLTDKEIRDFIKTAKILRMSCLVEVHTEDELDRALNIGAEILGVNNRNLKTLEVDTNTALNLMEHFPDSRIFVCESGIKSNDYVRKLKGKFNAILVGTLFMNSENVEKDMQELVK